MSFSKEKSLLATLCQYLINNFQGDGWKNRRKNLFICEGESQMLFVNVQSLLQKVNDF